MSDWMFIKNITLKTQQFPYVKIATIIIKKLAWGFVGGSLAAIYNGVRHHGLTASRLSATVGWGIDPGSGGSERERLSPVIDYAARATEREILSLVQPVPHTHTSCQRQTVCYTFEGIHSL